MKIISIYNHLVTLHPLTLHDVESKVIILNLTVEMTTLSDIKGTLTSDTIRSKGRITTFFYRIYHTIFIPWNALYFSKLAIKYSCIFNITFQWTHDVILLEIRPIRKQKPTEKWEMYCFGILGNIYRHNHRVNRYWQVLSPYNLDQEEHILPMLLYCKSRSSGQRNG